MPHTLADAKAVIYDTILHRRAGTAPEETPVIFDECTIEKPWGWVFFYNNERYFRTRDHRWIWVGPGPIFFHRESGEIREFGSGANLEEEIYDYEMELAAHDRSWCLWLTADQDRMKAIVNLKAALAIATQQAQAMVPALPHCLFAGIRRHLDWVAQRFADRGVTTEITLERAADVAQSVFTFPEQMINPSLAQAYHQRWDVVT